MGKSRGVLVAKAAGLAAALSICGLGFSGSALAANCTACQWTGTGATANWSDALNWGGTAPSATGSSLDFPALTGCPSVDPCYTSNNDSTVTSTSSLTIDGASPYKIGGSGITLGSGGLSVTTSSTSPAGFPSLSLPVTLGAPQTWTISGSSVIETFSLAGRVTGPPTDSLAINLGGGSITLGPLGSGSPVDDELGPVTATGGTRSGILSLAPGSALNANGGTVTLSNEIDLSADGNNTIGPLSISGDAITLQPNATQPSILQVNGGVTMTNAAGLQASIFGAGSPPTAGVDYTQLNASGPVSLTSADLQPGERPPLGRPTGTPCSTLHVGDVYTFVKAAGTITGQFGNAPAGSLLPIPCYGASNTGLVMQVNYNTTSPPESITGTVVSDTMTALSTSPASAVTNQPVTLTATVGAKYGSAAPTGTVEFDNHGSPVPGCSAQPVSSSGASGTGTASCQATFAGSSSPESLTAKFTPASGSGFHPSATSSPDSLTVGKASTSTKLSASTTSPSERQTVTYTATLNTDHSGPTRPSGAVEFLDGGSPIAGCSSRPLTAGSSSSTASCTTSYTAPGSHSITASYAGDGNFTGSSSSAQTVTIQRPPPGKVLLLRTKLKLHGHFVSVPLKCQSRLPCTGRFSITIRAQRGTGSHRHLATVLCSSRSFTVKAGKSGRIRAKISATCMSLVEHASGHRIKARFTARPQSGQPIVIKNVVLML